MPGSLLRIVSATVGIVTAEVCLQDLSVNRSQQPAAAAISSRDTDLFVRVAEDFVFSFASACESVNRHVSAAIAATSRLRSNLTSTIQLGSFALHRTRYRRHCYYGLWSARKI
jgi:hypothetical protein